MSQMTILEVVIGLVLVYLMLSLVCSAVQETIAAALGWRSNTLQEGIKNLLEDSNIKDAAGKVRDLTAELYKHPLIQKLGKKGRGPSYIPSRTFAVALFDILKDPSAQGGPLTQVGDTVSKLPDGSMKKALAGLIDAAQGNITEIRKNVENWFDDSMDRVSGWYKRNIQKWMMGIAFGLVVLMNVDSVHIAKRLWTDPQLRAQVVAHADVLVAENVTDPERKAIEELRQQLADLPIGWNKSAWDSLSANFGGAMLKLFGWVLTAIAVSLGAPFWFDGLGKLLSIRGAGRRPEKATS